MELKNYIVALCCFFTAVLPLDGQENKTLHVLALEPGGAAIEAAQAILRRSDKVLDYAFTDESGRCRLALPAASSDSLSLQVRLLGYQAETVQLSAEELARKALPVTLHPTAFELREVVVKEKIPPMVQRTDTLVYDAGSYRDGTERNVEALLKKMPGVEVDDNGKISVMGKNIDKVLIEGDDVFGANYRIGTQNISANLVGEVEVIDNYSDDPVLGQLKNANESVINLKLEEGKRQFAFGELQLQHGLEGASDNQLNVFALRKKTKAFLIGSNNTIGAPPVSVLDVGYMSGDNPGLNSSPLNRDGLLEEPVSRQPGAVPGRRLDDNESYQGAAVLLLKPSERLNARAMIYGLSHQNRLRSVEETRYYLNSDTLEVNNADRWNSQKAPLHAEARLAYRLSEQSRIRARWQGQSDSHRTGSRLFSETALGNDSLDVQYGGRPVSQAFQLSYAHRLNEQLAFTVEADGSLEDNRQQVRYAGNRYADPTALSVPSHALLQSATQSLRAFQLQTAVLFRHNGWKGGLKVGGRSQRSTTLATLFSEAQNNGRPQRLGPGYENEIEYGLREGVLTASLGRTFRKLSVQAEARLSRSYFQLGFPSEDRSLRRPAWLLQPSLNLEYQISNRSSLHLNWQHLNQPAAAENLLPAYYLSGYRALRRGLDTFYLRNTRSLNVRYQYTNAYSQMAFYAIYSRTALPLSVGQAVEASPWLDRIRLFLNNGSRTHMLKVHFDKYFPALSGNLKINARGLQVASENEVGNAMVLSRINSLQTDLEYRLSIGALFKPYIRAGYTLQSITNATSAESNTLAASHQYHYEMGLLVSKAEKFTFKAEAESFNWQLRGNTSSAFFIDAELQVPVLDEGRLSLLASATNLLNQDSLRLARVNIYSERLLNFGLRERIFLFGLRWKF